MDLNKNIIYAVDFDGTLSRGGVGRNLGNRTKFFLIS